MKCSVLKSRIFIILMTLLMLSPAFADSRPLLIVGEEFPPFEFMQDGRAAGIDIDIARDIFGNMNVPVEFRLMSWKRAWYMVETGEADAVLSTSRNSSREASVWFPGEAMWTSEVVFFVRKDRMIPDFRGYDTVIRHNLKIGIINGNSYHPGFWEAFPYKDGSTLYKIDAKPSDLNPLLEGTTNAELNIRKLAIGRIDLLILDRTVGNYLLKALGVQDQITHYNIVLYSKPYMMPFSKKSKYPDILRLSQQFDLDLASLKKRAAYRQYFDRWLK